MPFKFPYTNFQELNLDWIIKKVKDLSKQIEDDSSIVSEYIDRLIAVEDKADNAEATATAADAKATGANNTANSALTLATQAKQTAEIADLSTTLLGLKIGDLSSLYTTAKDTIVNAINEVWSIFHNATAVTNVTPAGTDPAVTYSNGVFTFDLPEGGDPDAVTHAELDSAIDDVEDTIDALTDRVDGLEDSIDDLSENKADAIIDTASGDIVDFPDGTATPLKSLIVNVEPVQAGTGDPSPSNVRPISGRNGLTIIRTGKNLLDPTKQTEDLPTRKRWYWTDGFLLKANVSYTFTEFHVGSEAVTVYIMPMDSVVGLASGTHSATYTPSEDTLVRFQAERSGGIPNGTIYQLSVGSTAADYEPYTSNSFLVSWSDEAGTIYGGIATYNGDGTWTLVVSKEIVDLGALSWTYGVAAYTYYYAAAPHGKICVQTDGVCNSYPFTDLGPPSAPMYSISVGQPYISQNYCGIAVRDDRYSGDVAAFKTAMDGVKLVYEVNNPQTYTITTGELITALKGYNNVWSDAGSVEVSYRADTKGYIDKLIAQVQALALGG